MSRHRVAIRATSRSPMTWIVMGSFGIGALMILVGAYAAGGGELTCERTSPASGSALERTASDPVVAGCRFVTRRWLGRRAAGESRFGPVTGAETIAVSVQESSTDSGGRRVDRWHLQLMQAGREVARFGGSREEVARDCERVNAWLQAGAPAPMQILYSNWSFGYAAMGFGLLWLGMTTMLARMTR